MEDREPPVSKASLRDRSTGTIQYSVIASRIQKVLMVLLCLRSGATEASEWAGSTDFDAYVAQTMRDFKVPGAAVAVVRNGNVLVARGYGLRDVENRLPVTTKTLFPIASITKSFTATTLGMLVDEGIVDWDKPVRDYLPDFRMY